MSPAADQNHRRLGPGPAGDDGGRGPTPGAGMLLALYPAAWRRRYGDELDALIVEMHADGGRARWRVRADLVVSAARVRLQGGGDPGQRIRSGSSLVLWAWALFVLAGAIIVKTTEHWQQALPARTGSGAQAAFDGLAVAAIVCAVLIAGAIAMMLPATARFVRDGGWPLIRTRALTAIVLSVIVVPALAAISLWAHGLTAAQRNGHDALYGAAVLCWAALAAACLLAWTALATRCARELQTPRATLRVQALIAPVVAIAMVAMTVATGVWWVVVGHDAPGALTGGSGAAHPSALVAPLVVAVVLMLVATVVAAVGAVRADVALGEL